MLVFIAFVYFVVGLAHANSKVNNPSPALRPVWASDKGLPFAIRTLGFVAVALIWPLSMFMSSPRQ